MQGEPLPLSSFLVPGNCFLNLPRFACRHPTLHSEVITQKTQNYGRASLALARLNVRRTVKPAMPAHVAYPFLPL